MKILFLRPSPFDAHFREVGHEVSVIDVTLDHDPDDGQVGRSAQALVRRTLAQMPDLDALFLPRLGATFYARNTVLKWSRMVQHRLLLGETNRRHYGRVAGCNVGPQHMSVFITDDEGVARENTSNTRTVFWTGSMDPVLAAIQHVRSGHAYNRKSPRPWR